MAELYERRIKLFRLDPYQVLRAFMNIKGRPECAELMELLDVPEDAQVVAVHLDAVPQSFLFEVHHPSFDVVAPGDIPPRVEAFVRVVKLRHETDDPVPTYVVEGL